MRTIVNIIVSVIVILVVNTTSVFAQMSRNTYRTNETFEVLSAEQKELKGEKIKYIPIHGDINYYVKVIAGYDKTHEGVAAGAAVGLRWNAFRLEAEGKWNQINPSAMGLIHVDILNARFTPFVTVGAGAGKQTTGFNLTENPETGEIKGVNVLKKFQFQYTVGAGISYRIIPHIQLELAYRLTGYPSENSFKNDRPELIKNLSANAQKTIMNEKLNQFGHTVQIGIRYHF